MKMLRYVALLLLLTLSACGGGGGVATRHQPPIPRRPPRIRVRPPSPLP